LLSKASHYQRQFRIALEILTSADSLKVNVLWYNFSSRGLCTLVLPGPEPTYLVMGSREMYLWIGNHVFWKKEQRIGYGFPGHAKSF
jgi:hypothetical protein